MRRCRTGPAPTESGEKAFKLPGEPGGMDAARIVAELERLYPGKRIVRLGEPVGEIICETDPAKRHPGYSVAVSVVDRIVPHLHKRTTETYTVLRGELSLTKDGVGHRLKVGDSLTILPGEVHRASGRETWIEARSVPGWTADDHYPLEQQTPQGESIR